MAQGLTNMGEALASTPNTAKLIIISRLLWTGLLKAPGASDLLSDVEARAFLVTMFSHASVPGNLLVKCSRFLRFH